MARLDLPRLFAGPRFTVAAVVLGNLIPVFGVAFLGWNGTQILILYWFENLIVGALTLPRILSARGGARGTPGGPGAGAVGTGCFFIVHYGIFCLAHGVFAFMLANNMTAAGVADHTLGRPDFWWTVLAIAVVHLILHVRDWWLAGAWRTAIPMAEMFRPYGRIFVLHLTVLGGAWLMAELKVPASAVLILCFGKMALELVGLFLGGRLRGSPA